MRSPEEIAYRPKQEARNVLLRAFHSSLREAADISSPLPFQPGPELVFRRLSESPFARECKPLITFDFEKAVTH